MTLLDDAIRLIGEYEDGVGCWPAKLICAPDIEKRLDAEVVGVPHFQSFYKGDMNICGVPVTVSVRVPPGTMYAAGDRD